MLLGRETIAAPSITGTENLIPGSQLELQNATGSPLLLGIGGIGESTSSALEGAYVRFLLESKLSSTFFYFFFYFFTFVLRRKIILISTLFFHTFNLFLFSILSRFV